MVSDMITMDHPVSTMLPTIAKLNLKWVVGAMLHPPAVMAQEVLHTGDESRWGLCCT